MVEAREGKDWKWSKFAWDDWLADPALSCCSAAARGVWMDLLAAAHKGIPPGHVTINGQAPSLAQLAKIARCSVRALPALLSELEQNGVFSRTSGGIIYSRRMVRDFESFQSAVKYGKRGGNPQLLHGLSHNSPVGGVNLESEEELESESESITGAPRARKGCPEGCSSLAGGLAAKRGGPAVCDRARASLATHGRGLPWVLAGAGRREGPQTGLVANLAELVPAGSRQARDSACIRSAPQAAEVPVSREMHAALRADPEARRAIVWDGEKE